MRMPSPAEESRLSAAVLVLALGVGLGASAQGGARGVAPAPGALCVTDFLPPGYVTDGSVSYQAALQNALTEAARSRRALVFPPMTYLLNDEAGMSVPSHLTLYMYGAVFRFDAKRTKDGQAFRGHDVTDVRFLGGTVVGQRDKWPDSANIAGIRITGQSSGIRIQDMAFRDLSSNGIGLFGQDATHPIRRVWVSRTLIRNCCNKYTDYLKPHPGPARGSDRRDQGGVAFYFVQNFVVSECSLEGSRSDGTHFYRCRDGQFVNNKVLGSQMGGYFLEACERILASGNLIRDNGSRGVTIERGSRLCTLEHNLIENSGREGLWAPDVVGCVVTDNLFVRNGRKDHDGLDSEIRINDLPRGGGDPANVRPENYRIANNTFVTTASQGAAIQINSGVLGVVIEHNTFRGARRTIRVDPWLSGRGRVVVRLNEGWKTEAAGTATFSADGRRSEFRIPHRLDFDRPADPRMLRHVRVLATVTAGSPDAARPHWIAADATHLVIRFAAAPPKGDNTLTFAWTARIAYPD